IGTCGSFYSFSGVHLVRIEKVYWLPTCERAGISSSIAGIHPPLQLPRPPSWLDLPSRIAVCCPAISHQNDFLHENMQIPEDREMLVENLELYSCISGI